MAYIKISDEAIEETIERKIVITKEQLLQQKAILEQNLVETNARLNSLK